MFWMNSKMMCFMSQSRGKIESLKCDGMRQDSAGFIIIILKSFLVIISGAVNLYFTFVAFFGRNLDYFIKSREQQVALFGLLVTLSAL